MFDPNDELIYKIFNKKFTFVKESEEYELPDEVFSSPEWKVPKLQSLKENLNKVKSKLNDKKIEIWSEHTKFMNPVKNIVHKVKGGQVRGEFVTQAWCKFYECLSNYKIINRDGDKINGDTDQFKSLHLCEAPGGFIAALNHYLNLNYESFDWKWRATTLNPYYEGNALTNMINDDRLILHTLDHWDFGRDKTGNIMKVENVEEILRNSGEVDLVTADGSIDCLLEPDRQEEIVAKLHLSEAIVALRALKPGGSFVLKMFTMFESSSICLLYLLNCLFSNVYIFKPSVSKEGNSEVYVICIKFSPKTDTKSYLERISIKLEASQSNTLFSQSSIPGNFVTQIEKCAQYFSELQIDVIERNLATFNCLSQYDQVAIRKLQARVTNEYLNICKLRPIPAEKRLLTSTVIDMGINLNPRRHVGSYAERKVELSDEEQVIILQERLRESFQSVGSWPGSVFSTFFACKTAFEVLVSIMGLPITEVCSSKFVFAPELRLFREVYEKLSKRYEEGCTVVLEKSKQNEQIILEMKIFSYFHYRKNYQAYEQQVALEVLRALKELTVGKNLIVKQLPLLTQFLAGLVFYLANFCFTRTIFYNESVIVFEGFLSNPHLPALLEALELKGENKNDETVIGLVNIPQLFYFEYHHAVIQYNMATLFLYNLEYLRKYEALSQ